MSAAEIGKNLNELVAFLSGTEWSDIPVPVRQRAALVLCLSLIHI